jgi:hypothetical protein
MEELGISFTGILVATVVNFFVGFMWYSFLFQKPWAAEMGMAADAKPQAGSMIRGLIMGLIGNFLMAYVFAHNNAAWSFVPGMEKMSTTGNIMSATGFTWLGFYLPSDLNTVAWEGKSWKLFAINTGYHFTIVLVAAIILYSL